MSRNDIVLLACGSRSMSSVRFPRSASAAARLMAVVVLPTPPFWFAMATIMKSEVSESAGSAVILADARSAEARPYGSISHLVFAQIVGVEALEPLVQPIGVGLLRRRIHRLRVVDHRVLD